MNNVATKQEVLHKLSEVLRNREGLKDETFLKVLGTYARLQGWLK
jgi:hypothetical protein